MRVDKTCVHPDCTRNCFYDDRDVRNHDTLVLSGWLFRPNGDALCPPHARYLDAVMYFDQFAAL